MLLFRIVSWVQEFVQNLLGSEMCFKGSWLTLQRAGAGPQLVPGLLPPQAALTS